MDKSESVLVRTLIECLPKDDRVILPLSFLLPLLKIEYSTEEDDRITQLIDDTELAWFKDGVDYRIAEDEDGESEIYFSRFGFELLCRKYKHNGPSRINEFAKAFLEYERRDRSALAELKETI